MSTHVEHIKQYEMHRLTESSFDDTDLRSGSIQSSERTPIIDDETSTDDLGTSVNCTSL